jgi:hypothetical protein
VPFGLPLASLLLAAASARAPAAATCPADARVEVNLAAWRAALQQADSPRRRDDVLGELKLSLDLPEPETPDARAPRVSLLGVDDTATQLGAGGRPDHVVQVRYGVESGDDKSTIFLVQVLRPLEERRWCALGDELSRRDDGPKKLERYQLGFVPLLDAHSKAIEVERGEAQLRRNDTFREYWVVQGWKLRKVFDERIGSMHSAENVARTGTGAGEAMTTTAKIGKLKLTGGFPRRIELLEITKRASCEVGTGEAPCDDSEPSSFTTFTYDGGQYVRRR